MANNPIERFLELRIRFFNWLLSGNASASIPWWKKAALKVTRIIAAVLRDLSDGQLNMRAMSLVYTSLLSLVPLLAISFSVLKGFGVHNKIEPFLLNVLSPLGQERFEIVPRIIGFVDNIKVGVLGFVGIAVLFYTVIALMTKIERAFNYTWNVSESRRFAARFSDYLSVLLIGPMLIFISVGLTTNFYESEILLSLSERPVVAIFIELLHVIIPYLLLTGAFAFIYVFMPNTRVKPVPALIGGAVTAIMWKVLGLAFATIVTGSASYSAIYSAFATLIFFMIWLYAGWLVLLIGACIAYYVQNPSNVLISRDSLIMSNEMRERLALSIIGRVGLGFYTDAKTWTVEDLAEVMKLPIRVVQRSVGTLKGAGILVQDGMNPFHLIPGKPFDTLTISELLKAVRSSETERGFIASRAQSEVKVLEMMDRIDRGYQKEFGRLTIKQWVLDIQKKQKKTKAKRKKK